MEERRAPAAPPQVKLEFLPEPAAAAGIAKQIKQSGRAYPLYGTGRLFLEKPERHRVRISSLDPTVVLYQIGDGPIALDQAALERAAFQEHRAEYYEEIVTQSEPIKGNFANVARSRSSGLLLGPTSYHSYQPGLRRLYEERFSRRMSFQDFLYQDIEIRTDERSVADWKEQARSTTTYRTRKEETLLEFKTLPEVEQHFRTTYLRQLIKAGLSLECSGPASRQFPERALAQLLRESWEREKAFPGGLVNQLRPYLMEAGLQFFKHRKRILYLAASKPKRHQAGEAMSSGPAAILRTIEEIPKCTRRTLATKLLGAQADAPEMTEQKSALARDLLYLLHAGHVLEFHDGTLDLPLAPAPPQSGGKTAGSGKRAATAAPEAGETEEEASPSEADEIASATEKRPPASAEEEVASSSAMTAEAGGAAHEPLPNAHSLESGEIPESRLSSLSEGAFASMEAGAPVPSAVITPESELPSVEMPAGGPPPENPPPDEPSEFVATFEETAPLSSEPAPPELPSGSYRSEQEFTLPGAASLADELPVELVTPTEIVDLRHPAPVAEHPRSEG